MAIKKFDPYAKCDKAVIFARVSTQHQQDEGYSIDAQLEIIRDYCKKNGFEIIKEYVLAESSTRGDRKQYHEMLNFVQNYKDKIAIVVNCVDRLQRSYKDTPALDEMRKDGKIEVHFLKENLILTRDSTGMEIMFWNMSVLMASAYILSMVDNVKRSQKYNRSQGKFQNYAPIGYMNCRDEDKKATIKIDPERGPLVKALFEEYAKGTETLGSLTKLAKDMNLRSRQNKSGKTISREHVRDILNNPFYYGMMKSGNDWVRHQYEPLIDKTLFDIVQDVLKGKKKQNFTMGGPDKDFIFRGLLRCGHCGGCITSEYHISKSGKRHNYLKCNNHGASKSNCPQCVVREEDILQQLNDQVFSQIHVNEDFINAVKSGVKEQILQENRVNRASKQSIALQIQSIRNRESKLMDLYLNGKCTQALYDKKSAEFEEEIKKLEAGLEQNDDVSKDVVSALNHIIDIAGQAATIMNCSINSKKREFLKTILSNGILTGTSACFYLKKPFEKLLFSKGCKMWLGQLDSNQ